MLSIIGTIIAILIVGRKSHRNSYLLGAVSVSLKLLSENHLVATLMKLKLVARMKTAT